MAKPIQLYCDNSLLKINRLPIRVIEQRKIDTIMQKLVIRWFLSAVRVKHPEIAFRWAAVLAKILPAYVHIWDLFCINYFICMDMYCIVISIIFNEVYLEETSSNLKMHSNLLIINGNFQYTQRHMHNLIHNTILVNNN